MGRVSGSRARVASFLRPGSIALIGASANPDSPGGRTLLILKQHGFAGEIYLVNPNQDQIDGTPCLPSIAGLPEGIDLALVAIAAPMVPGALRELAARGMRAAYVISSGFAEAGKGTEGEGLQTELEAVLAEIDMAVGGPNAEGIYNIVDDIAIGFSPTVDYERGLRERPTPGNVAVLSHSGGLGFGIFQRGLARNIDFTHVVSTGNEADLDALDYLEYLLEDDRDTTVVVLFLEGVSSIARLEQLALRAHELGKTIVAAKVGRTAQAQAAAISHTGHMTGPSELYSAVFRRVGIVEVTDFEDLLDTVAVLSKYPRSTGPRIGIVTGSGGSGAWLTDVAAGMGAAIPVLSADTQAELLPQLPYFASVRNPVDMTASAAHGSSTLGTVLRTVADSDEIDAVIAIESMIVAERTLARLESLKPILPLSKPLLSYTYTAPAEEGAKAVAAAGVPWFPTQRGVTHAALVLAQRGADHERLGEAAERKRILTARSAQPVDRLWPADRPRPESVPEFAVKRWFTRHGLPVPAGRLVADADEAAAAAAEIGFPVVLKAQSSLLPHKGDAGVLALSLHTVDDLRAAFSRVDEAARAQVPAEKLDGVLVEAMAAPGYELLIGAGVSEALDGFAFLTVGRGGGNAEVFADIATIPAPTTAAEVRTALRGLRCWRDLHRDGADLIDLDAFCALAARMSELVDGARGTLRELDVNPVLIGAPGEGVAIVDGLASLAE
ncbi:acetate--CoA ligase family protein [Streptomyces sp. NPDC050625]|uniref:acetate--CoA ligase family protein n=1 Tax=Streptomyces sp. NPDC050625 TaxID=3154629 RepID=UPI0034201CA2